MSLLGLKIGFALTGSFCTIRKAEIGIENLVKEGVEVFPIISESVKEMDTRFGKANEIKDKIEDLTGKKVISTIQEAESIGPGNFLNSLVILPCTGNTLAKIANSITDSTVTMACKALLRNQKPLIISVSTNDGFGGNAKNIGLLINTKYIYFIPFKQDNPQNKPNSLVANTSLLLPTIEYALEGKQLQPILCV